MPIMPARSLQHAFVPFLLCILATAGAYCAGKYFFQWVPITTDENSYIFQAYNFLDGLVSRPMPPFQEAFQYKMIILTEDAGWLSRYTFGHALFLVPGILLGSAHFMPALAAGLTLFFVYRSGSLLGGKTLGITAGTLLLFSPFFLFYHGTLLSHTSGLLASSLMLLMYISWRKTENIYFAALSGLAWGWLFNNRTYTALLIAIPFAIDALIYLYHNRNRKVFIGTSAFAFTATAGIITLLIYNTITVGDPWTMTYLYHNPTDNLGFGQRYYGRIEHTFSRGLEILATNLQLLNVWLWGFWGSLLLGLLAVMYGWTTYWSRLFVSVILCVGLGHIFFWYPGPREAGPGYFLEIVPFLILGASFGVRRFLGMAKKWHLALALAILFPALSFFVLAKGREIRDMTMQARQLIDILHKAPRGSLIFIDPEEHHEAFRMGNDIIFNPRGLDGNTLLARSMGEQDTVLMRYFREYAPFRLAGGDAPGLLAVDPARKYQLEMAGHAMHRHTGENRILPSGETSRAASEGSHPEGMMAFGRYIHVSPGEYDVEFVMQASGCAPDQKIFTLDVAVDHGRKVLAAKEIFGDVSDRSAESILTVAIAEYTRIEPRVYYHSCGNVALEKVRIRERTPE